MLKPVAGNLKRYHMLPAGARVGVAVSGGADSVCLLDVLAALAPSNDWTLIVLHLNHGWRGDQSDMDARFVERLAAHYGLPCVVGRAPAPAAGANLEQQGRDARRRFFAGQREALALDRIATGHTLDDQAETVLFRALRGSGTGGLAGILPVTAEGIVRPLLVVDRAWVTRWIQEKGLEWREDPTNADPRFRRNALRAVLPELSRLVNPAARGALARLAEVAYEEEIHWSRLTAEAEARVLSEEDGAVVLETAVLMDEGRAMARRLIRRSLERVRGGLRSIGHEHVEKALGMAVRTRGEGRITLPGAWVERSCGWLRIAAGPVQPIEEKQVVGSTGAAVLRGWRAGDQFDGRPLRDLFRKKNVPRWRRVRWPVVASGSEIYWAEGVGWSEAGRREGWPMGNSLSEIRKVSI